MILLHGKLPRDGEALIRELQRSEWSIAMTIDLDMSLPANEFCLESAGTEVSLRAGIDLCVRLALDLDAAGIKPMDVQTN